MKVIKRDSRIQEFDKSKIETSILNSADDIGKKLNISDMKLLINAIIKEIDIIRSDESNTSSYEVLSIVGKVLKENGFKDIAISYEGHIK